MYRAFSAMFSILLGDAVKKSRAQTFLSEKTENRYTG